MAFMTIVISLGILLAIRPNTYLCAIYWFLLAIISAFRYKVGTDYDNYIRVYNEIVTGVHTYLQMEPFHLGLVKFADFFGLGYQFVFFIYSLLTMLVFALAFFRFYVFKIKPNPKQNGYLITIYSLMFFGGYYLLTLNSIRSCLATAFYFLGTKYYLDKNSPKMILCFVIGSCAHFSMIPIALVTWVYLKMNLLLSKKWMLLLLFLAVINPIGIVADVFIKYQLPYYNYFISERFAVPASMVGRLSTYISVIGVLLLYLYLDKIKELFNRRFLILVQFSILLFILFRLIGNDLFVFVRMSKYFTPIILILSSVLLYYFVSCFKQKDVLLVLSLCCLVLVNTALYLLRSDDVYYNQYSINYCFSDEYVCKIDLNF